MLALFQCVDAAFRLAGQVINLAEVSVDPAQVLLNERKSTVHLIG